MKKHKQPTAIAIDFFCGAGGTTRGFIDSGIYVLAGIDIDLKCKDTYTYKTNNLNPWTGRPPIFIGKDIVLNKNEILSRLKKIIREAKNKYPEALLVFSICAPCQPFTSLAKIKLSQGTATKRLKDKSLLEESLYYVHKLKPDAIFMENVPGIKNVNKAGGLFDLFSQKLSKKYKVKSRVINAKYFGVPQSRRRTVLLAIVKKFVKTGDDFAVLEKDPKLSSLIVVSDILGTGKNPKFLKLKAGGFDKVDLNHRAGALTPVNLERIKKAVPGKGNYLLDSLRVNSHKRKDSAGNKYHHTDVYGRMDPKKVAPTITTKCFSYSNGRYGYPYKSQNRAITIREAAVLQTFPKTYKFFPLNEITQPGKQIGNAVPPKLSEFFSKYLISKIKQC
jgi:DNA (cytosine-5)-methyltransferase 1